MSNIKNNLYPDGKKFCLTMSYDDGRDFDRRVVEIFNKNGIRGTFHLVSARLDAEGYVSSKEISSLYQNHEVSCHTLTHPFLQYTPISKMIDEIRVNKEKLEKACGYTVRGMSYPYGNYNNEIINVMKMCGMNYSRTTIATNAFGIPDNFMTWHPTTHHNGKIKELYNSMLNQRFANPHLLYIWGHSYEFNNDNSWNMLEEFCEMAGGNPDVWYATNIEIYDYITAQRRLEFSVDGNTCFNPSSISVWVTVDGKPWEIRPGENKFQA